MDPVSYLFSAYLNLVQQQVSDIYGAEPKTLGCVLKVMKI